MHQLNYELKNLCNANPAKAYSTQRDRQYNLSLIANQLREAGYKDLRIGGLKGRHVEALVKRWKDEKLNPGTINNRMSSLRWWATMTGRKSVVAGTNRHYGIEMRVRTPRVNRAKSLPTGDLNKVCDFHVRLSLELQREFGLRREESIKFVASYADQGERIVLKASWCKGGRSREIPIRTESQRELLNRIRASIEHKSLIPVDRRYVDQLRIYERETARAGLSKMHGLRHAYAQRRYEELTGWPAPAAGGPGSKELTPEQKDLDRESRLTISRELGHEREAITVVYLSR